MSAEIDSVISSAMASLDTGGSDGGDSGDTGDSGGTDDLGTDTGTDTADVPAADPADEAADAGGSTEEADASGLPAEPVDTRSADDIAFDAELAELGLAAPKPGQKDNRIPYSRIRKIVANAKTKWSEKLKGEHTTVLTAKEQKLAEYEQSAQEYAAAERLLETDPERYISILATLYPQHYKKYVSGGQAQADPAQERAKADPEPTADIKYDDGSYGFSADQFAKLRDWDRREAARVAKAEFDSRLKPFEDREKAKQQEVADIKRVRGDIGKLREHFGADEIDNPDVQKAIVAYMDANPKASLAASTREVIAARRKAELDKLQANRTTMRAELLKELGRAPKAAAASPVTPTKSDSVGSESYEDIIKNAMRGIR